MKKKYRNQTNHVDHVSRWIGYINSIAVIVTLLVTFRTCSIQSDQADQEAKTDRPFVIISIPETPDVLRFIFPVKNSGKRPAKNVSIKYLFTPVDFSRTDVHHINSLSGVIAPQDSINWPIVPNFGKFIDHGYFMAVFSYGDAFSDQKYENEKVIYRFVRQENGYKFLVVTADMSKKVEAVFGQIKKWE